MQSTWKRADSTAQLRAGRGEWEKHTPGPPHLQSHRLCVMVETVYIQRGKEKKSTHFMFVPVNVRSI